MKTRETKQKELALLKESLGKSKSAIIVSFNGASVAKDWELRRTIREAGAEYRVVKNTIARLAVRGTDYEQASDAFKGVSAIAWTDKDPVVLSKAISKFIKDNADVYSFKSGVVDGKVIDFNQLGVIANLPSKEELIAKLLYVLNAQAQRLVTVINAVPRNLAVVIKQIGDKAPEARSAASGTAEAANEAPAESTATTEPASAGDAAAEDATPAEAAGEEKGE